MKREKTISNELMDRMQLLGIIYTAAPDNRPEIVQMTDIGVCRFCGQYQTLNHPMMPDEANEYAERNCNCPDAVRMRDRLDFERRRAAELDTVRDNIDDLFGYGAPDRGADCVCTPAIDALNYIAAIVYDRKIAGCSLKLTAQIQAKIVRTKSGGLAIERKDAQVSKFEV